MDHKVWQWECTKDSQTFVVSSDKTLLPISFVQEAFATEAMYWTPPLSDSATATMLANSLTLGLYKTTADEGSEKPKLTPIGMARLITDYTTLIYLTDVYVNEAYQGLGLGKWMIRNSRRIALEMPHLRFMVLLTGSEQAQALYRRELGMSLLNGHEQKLTCMGARSEKLAEAEGQQRA